MSCNTTDMIEYLIEVDRTFKTRFIDSMSESTITEIKRLSFEVDYFLRFGKRLAACERLATKRADEYGAPARKYKKTCLVYFYF